MCFLKKKMRHEIQLDLKMVVVNPLFDNQYMYM